MSDYDSFPAQVYSDSVLSPDFDVYKQHFADALHAINLAHAVMLNEQDLLAASDTEAILGALVDIDSHRDWKNKTYDGSFEDLFFLIEQQLASQVGEKSAGLLHLGRSRNDMEHTMFRIQLRERLLDLLTHYDSMVIKILQRAERGSAETVLLYTHGQPAQVSVLGHYLGAVAEFLLRDMARLIAALQEIDKCPMGAAAITTTGFPLNRQRVAELLGFPAIVENSYGAIANVDHITACYSAIKLGCIHLGRFVQDLVTWTGFEVSQIHVPDGLVQISSIMPQKRNPVPLEHLRLKFSLAAGAAEQVIHTMHNTPFADMNDSERETQATGFQAFERLQKALPLLGGFVESMEVDADSVERRIQLSMATITELADTLVRHEGLGFREAHSIAQQLARFATDNRIALNELPFDEFIRAFESQTGKPPTLSSEAFGKANSPSHFVAVRELPGGPGPKALHKSLSGYQEQLSVHQATIAGCQQRLSQAQRQLSAEVSSRIQSNVRGNSTHG